MKALRSLWPLLGCCAACWAGDPEAGGDGYRGLQIKRSDFRVSCGTVAFPCDAGSRVALYSGALMARPVGVELHAQSLRDARLRGTTVGLVGRARMAEEVGVYGRLGTTFARSQASLLRPAAETGAGLSYAVGVSWDFSPSASAILGWEAYDLRFAGGERDTVRATSLGLQWRY